MLGGPPDDRVGPGLPRGPACVVQHAVDDRAHSDAKRVIPVTAPPAKHFLDQSAGISYQMIVKLDDQMEDLAIRRNPFHGERNYTLAPWA